MKWQEWADKFEERSGWGVPRLVAYYFFAGLERFLNLPVYRVWVGSGIRSARHDQLPKEIPEEYPTCRLEPRDLIPYASEKNGLDEAFLEGAQTRGDRATAVFSKNKIVSYSFESTTRTPFEHDLELLIPPGFLYAYKSWTHPDFRRRGLTKYIGKVKFDERWANGGLKRGIWYIKFHNYPSLLTNVYQQPQHRPLYVGSMVVLKALGRTVYFNSRRAKWFGCVLVREGEAACRTYPYT
jgi:hypothetical protein